MTDDPHDEPLGFSLVMFEHVVAYTDVYLALVGGRGGVVAISELRKVLSEFVRKELSAAQDDAISRELVVQFVVGALMTVLTWWLERRPGLTPSQADAMFRRLVLNGIRPLLRAKSRGG
jgi:hypothetical protein